MTPFTRADVQAAFDDFQRHIAAAGGDPGRGLLDWAHSAEGRAAISNHLFDPVLMLYAILTMPAPTALRSRELGHGMTAHCLGGKWQVWMQDAAGSGMFAEDAAGWPTLETDGERIWDWYQRRYEDRAAKRNQGR
jgi:hypothetical protein